MGALRRLAGSNRAQIDLPLYRPGQCRLVNSGPLSQRIANGRRTVRSPPRARVLPVAGETGDVCQHGFAEMASKIVERLTLMIRFFEKVALDRPRCRQR
jgi:hypothetical protein